MEVIQGNRWMLHLVYLGASKDATKRGIPLLAAKGGGQGGLSKVAEEHLLKCECN